MEVQSSGIYIYKAMDRSVGYGIIDEKLETDPVLCANLKKTGQAIWLLRESNTEGMLSLDAKYFEDNAWTTCTCRFLLSERGWIEAQSLDAPEVVEALKSIKKIYSIAVGQYVSQLDKLICIGRFNAINRINPERDMQTINNAYSSYDLLLLENNCPQPKKVTLTVGVNQAITCELSQKIFKDPVIMTKKFKSSDYICEFYRGKSYERSELEKYGVPNNLYYPNRDLKDVINCVGSLLEEKIVSIENERILDPIYYNQFDQPYALPSGFSISEETLQDLITNNRLICPRSTQTFTAEQAVSNKNLKAFIDEWKDCKDVLLESTAYKMHNVKLQNSIMNTINSNNVNIM